MAIKRLVTSCCITTLFTGILSHVRDADSSNISTALLTFAVFAFIGSAPDGQSVAPNSMVQEVMDGVGYLYIFNAIFTTISIGHLYLKICSLDRDSLRFRTTFESPPDAISNEVPEEEEILFTIEEEIFANQLNKAIAANPPEEEEAESELLFNRRESTLNLIVFDDISDRGDDENHPGCPDAEDESNSDEEDSNPFAFISGAMVQHPPDEQLAANPSDEENVANASDDENHEENVLPVQNDAHRVPTHLDDEKESYPASPVDDEHVDQNDNESEVSGLGLLDRLDWESESDDDDDAKEPYPEEVDDDDDGRSVIPLNDVQSDFFDDESDVSSPSDSDNDPDHDQDNDMSPPRTPQNERDIMGVTLNNVDIFSLEELREWLQLNETPVDEEIEEKLDDGGDLVEYVRSCLRDRQRNQNANRDIVENNNNNNNIVATPPPIQRTPRHWAPQRNHNENRNRFRELARRNRHRIGRPNFDNE